MCREFDGELEKCKKMALDNPDFFGYVDAARRRPTVKHNPIATHLVKSSAIAYRVILGGTALWCSALVLPPVFLAAGGICGAIGATLYQSFHQICHQLDERSFHILGKPFAVCIRCSSIYLSFLVGVISYSLLPQRVRSFMSRPDILLWSLLPMLVDVALDVFGIRVSTVVTRIFTGSAFGIAASFIIVSSAKEGVHELITSFRVFPSEIRKGSLNA